MSGSQRISLYVVGLVLLAAVSLGYAISQCQFVGIDSLTLFFCFVVLSVLAEIYATWIPSFNWEISSSIAMCLAGLFILGPYWAVLQVLLSSLVSELLLRWNSEDGKQRTSFLPIAFNVSQLVVAISIVGFVLRVLGHSQIDFRTINDFAIAIAAFFGYVLLNLSFVNGIIVLTEGRGFFRSLWDSIRPVSYTHLRAHET